MRLILAFLVCVMLSSGLLALMKHETGANSAKLSETQRIAKPGTTIPSLTPVRPVVPPEGTGYWP